MTRTESSRRSQSVSEDKTDATSLFASRQIETRCGVQGIESSKATSANQEVARVAWWRWILVAGYFIFANLWLINDAWILNSEQTAAALGVPFSQCSLIAFWAVASRTKLVARFALTILNTLVCWYTMTQIFYWGIGDPTSAAWAITLCTQVLMVAFAAHVFLVTCQELNRLETKAAFRIQSYISFDLRTLMLWTTTFAVGFGFIQWGRIQFGWSGSIAEWPHVQGMPLIGIFNAAIALLMAWISQAATWTQIALRLGIAASLMAVICFALPYTITLATGTNGLDSGEIVWLAISQGVHLLVALLLLSDPRHPFQQHRTEPPASPA